MRDNIRLLATTLGLVIGRLEGEACFQAVELLRRACKGRRLGQGTGTLQDLLAWVETFDLASALNGVAQGMRNTG